MKKLFNKIRLVNDIAGEVVSYGVQCAGPQFMDYIDMNCGAIPDGPFESVIDPDSPRQFLSLYVQVAHKRLAFAVSKVIEFNPDALSFIRDFVFNVGKNNQPSSWQRPAIEKSPLLPQQVFDVLSWFILDDFEDRQTIIEQDDRCIKWKVSDCFSEFWKQSGGQPESYCILLKAFVEGMLDGTGIVFELSEDGCLREIKYKEIP